MIAGGSLELTSTSTPSTVANFDVFEASLSGAAEVDVTNSFSGGEAGRLEGPGSVVIEQGATGIVNRTNGSQLFLEGGTLVNDGSLTVGLKGGIIGTTGAKLLNHGTLTINGEGQAHGLLGGAQLINGGTVQKTEGSGTSFVTFPIENEGTITSTSNRLALAGGGTPDSHTPGRWTTSGTEATVQFYSGIFSLGPHPTFAGSIVVDTGATVNAEEIESDGGYIELDSGTLEVGGVSSSTIADLYVLSGTLTGSAEVDVANSFRGGEAGKIQGTGTTVIEPGASGIVDEENGSQLFLEGSKLVNDGSLTVGLTGGIIGSKGAMLTNAGILTLNGEVQNGLYHGLWASPKEALFRNFGTLVKTEGTGETPIRFAFDNQGIVEPRTGKFEITEPIALETQTQWGGPDGPSTPNHPSARCGEPISCATGNFSETETDLAIGGRGVGLNLSRTYNAQAASAGMHGPFGYGWSSAFSDHLVAESSSHKATFHQAEGSTVPFTEGSGGSFAAPAWTPDTLSGSEGSGYTLTLSDQTKYKFSGSTGRLESVTDRNGNATTISYNSEGNVQAITDPAGRKITLAYHEGLVESATDPMGHTVKYTYEEGNLKSVTEPGEASPRWQFKYDGSHRMTKLIDGRGGETANEYDSSNRVTSQTDPAGRTLAFEYEPFQTKITNHATGSVTDEYFTSQDEPVSITHGFGTAYASTAAFTYDEAGDVLSGTDGSGHTTKYTYDSADDRTSMLDPDNHETKWEYNSTHDVISTTTPSGEKTTIKRDSHGNAEVVERPAPSGEKQITKYAYDAHGNLTSMEDPLKRTWKYEYDNQGDRTSETDPEGDKRTSAYNEDSQETSTTSPRGNAAGAEPASYTTMIVRDYQGRPLTVTEPLAGAASSSAAPSSPTTLATGAITEPAAVAVSKGHVWVADSGSDRLEEFGEEGKEIEHFGTFGSGAEQFEDPVGIAVDSEGHVWVADALDRRIDEFYENGKEIRNFATGGFPRGLALDSQGDVWVIAQGATRVLEFKKEGTEVREFGSSGAGPGQFLWPCGIAIAPNGDVWVADTYNHRVQKFSETGVYLGRFGSLGSGTRQFHWPAGVTVAPNGNVWVADTGNSRVQELSENGEYLAQFGEAGSTSNQLSWPDGTAIDSKGNVWVADTDNGRIQKWEGAGVTTPAHATKYTYDPNGNLKTVTDPDGHTTTYQYDADNEPIKVAQPNGDVTETAYDGAGQVISQTDGNKHTSKYVRNALEQVTEVIDPLARKATKEYDLAGNLKSLTDAAGRTTTYIYDPDNRLTEVKYSDGETPTVKYEYDADGNRTKIIDGTGETTYTYDQLDRLVKTKDGHGDTTAYEYDLANEQTKITYPNGKTVSRAYDNAGRLHSVTDWLANTTTFSYNPDSDLTTTTFPAGTGEADEYAYNNADAMSEVTMTKNSEKLALLGYTRDRDGQVTNTLSEGLPGEHDTAYEYDEDSRLTTAGTSAYGYDAANNPTTTPGSTNTYDNADELSKTSGATYTYNKLGERSNTKPESGPTTTYGYDQAGNLISVTRPAEGSIAAIADTYAYNGEGLRTSQTISGSTSYLTWDMSEALPLILNDGTNSYIYGLGGFPIEQINALTGTVTYLHDDQQGSTRLLTGSTGTVTGKCGYSLYGTPTCEGSATTPLGFDGQYTNSDTGLIYMRARTYDPATTEFLSVDPFVALTGEPYSYSEDDPINRYDPTGRCGFVCIGGIVLGGLAVASGIGAVVVGAAALATALATASAVAGVAATIADTKECVIHGGIACVGAGVGFVAAAGAGVVVVGAGADVVAGATAIGITTGGIGFLSDLAGGIAPSSASGSPVSLVSTESSACG